MAGDEAVLEEKPGPCPVCKMPLVAARLDSKWWCPVHQTLSVADGPGKCKIDRQRDLVQVTLREFWTCPGSDNKLDDPTPACPGGTPRKIGYEIRAHGDHNPRHGGQFFMAEDKWHHIEGALPSANLFKVYFYDNFTKPMGVKDFSGSMVILDQSFKEIASYPLKAGADGVTMEAQIPAANAKLPMNAAARISFGPNLKPQLFNFPFNAISKEPVGAAAPPATKQGAVAKPVRFAASAFDPKPFSFRALATAYEPEAAQTPAAGAPQQPSTGQVPNILDSPLQISAELANALDEEKLPKTVPELLNTLTSRLKEIETLVNDGSLGQAWLPAMGTKTVALVLGDHAASLPERQRTIATAAAARVITAAWEIDAYGDLGNLQQIVEAFKRMTSAVSDLKGAYASAR